jgi:hypothetical protein
MSDVNQPPTTTTGTMTFWQSVLFLFIAFPIMNIVLRLYLDFYVKPVIEFIFWWRNGR